MLPLYRSMLKTTTTLSLLAALLLSACASTNVTVTDTKKSYPRTESVQILNTPPARQYEALAKLEATGSALPTLPNDKTGVLKKLGNKAKSIGADAVIVTNETTTVAKRGVIYAIQGTAIKYLDNIHTVTAAATTGLVTSDPVKVEVMAPTSSAPRPAARANWLQSQNPDHYTIQLLASRKQGAIQQYIEEHSLGGQVGHFKSLRGGQIWFTLVYGAFATKASARQAIGSLPPSLRRTSPWVRRMGDVQTLAGVRAH
ncbi:MAG TPA: hypothetical protein ENI80_08290 [Acidiferrobacteraceae bacterium]|nr:hypothetical protein [Acidiferrobacteraceae bacterium]